MPTAPEPPSDLDRAITWAREALGLGASDRIALVLPGPNPLSALDRAIASAMGATVVDPDPSLTSGTAVAWLATARITVLHLLPSMALAWTSLDTGARLPSVRHLLLSGEPVGDPAVERLRALCPHARLWQLASLGDPPLVFAAGEVGRPARSGIHPLPPPLPGLALDMDEQGELTVLHPSRGRLSTGIPVRRRPGGRFEPLVTDGDPALLAKEIGEIEVALAGLDGARGAAVVRPLGETGEPVSLTAFVAGEPDRSALREALDALARDDLGALEIIHLPDLPRRLDGAVDREKLRQSAALARKGRSDLGEQGHAPIGPRTETEAAVAGLWQKLLGARVGVDDDFFLAGGQSLLAAQLAARLSAQLGVDLPLSLFFQLTTVAGQAAFIDREKRGENPKIEPPPRPARGAPLTYAAEQMVLFEQLSPGTDVHKLMWLFRIEGPLDPARLAAALGALTERHPALRTVIRAGEEGPEQQVLTAPRPSHEEHDLSALGEAAEDAAHRHAQAAFRAPFDLERGPLCRTLLFTLAPARSLLALQVHHAVMDAWSLNTWMSELGEIYAALSEGRAPSLPPLAVTPIDLARAERDAVASGALAGEIDFWRATLRDRPAGLDLPADLPRPRRPSHRGHFVAFAVPSDVTRALREIARREGATLFMALLTALDLLLCRLSAATDLIVGTPVLVRDRPELGPVIGLFLNNVAIRVDASNDPTYRALLARARDAARAALAHPALPFARVIAETSITRDPERHPIFDVMLNLVPEVPGLRLPDLAVETIPGHNESSPLDLLVSLRELDDGSLAGDLRAAADLFSPATASRLARRLTRVLIAVAEAPDTPISAVPLLDDDEQQEVTERYNVTHRPLPESSLPALIEAAIDAHAAEIAVFSGDRSLTFDEVGRRSSRIAHLLLGRGLSREDRVAVLLRRGLDLAPALLGILQAGGAFVLLDPDLPPARIAAMLRAAEVHSILSERALEERVPPDLKARTTRLDDPGALAGASEGRPALSIDPGDLAYVMFTSGSTGVPKGVLVSHGALANRIEWVRALFPFAPGEVACQKTPLGFIDAIWVILGPLRDGVPCLVPSDETALDPAALIDALERGGVTRIMLVPSVLRAWLHHRREGAPFLPRLTLWLIGGEELRIDLCRALSAVRPDAAIVNLYGCSEVAGESTFHRVSGRESGRIPIGLPGPNARAYVLDAAGKPCPIGVYGELHLGGAGVARGYLGDPAQTARRFVPDPFHPGGRMFRTGDRARRLDGGALDYAGRLDQEVKVRGVRIDPAEIEEALRTHEAVLDAAVIAGGEAGGDRRLVAYVVHRDPALPASPSALRRHLRRLLPEAMVPSILTPIAALPLSPSGKVQKDALPPPIEEREQAARPSTATEQALAAIWAELLGEGAYDPDDDFFARGGYSLLLGRLALRIRQAFEIDVPLGALFSDPTLAGQAQQIEIARLRSSARPPLVRAPRAGRLPLSFAQERLWLSENLKFDALRHVVAVAFRLRGPLDRDRLDRSLRAVADRHESLRTTFSSELGIPFQVVHPSLPRAHEEVDLSALDAAGRDAEIARRKAREYSAPFDLAKGPPWRSALLVLGPEEHVLLVTMSHLVSDATSIQRWLVELSACYEHGGRAPPELTPLPIQPADLAVWSRACLSLGMLDADRAYWREALGGAPPPVEIPADGRRGPGDSGGWIAARVPSDTLLRLRALAQDAAGSLFSAFLAVLGQLLAELTGDGAVSIGVLSSGRNEIEAEPLIGLFLNAVPVRFRAALGFAETLRQGQIALQDALAHSALPFERIVAEVGAVRQPRRNPLFDVVLNHLPHPGDLGLGEAKIEPLDPPAVIPSPFDLMWRLIERPSGMTIRLEYHRGLFTEARARAMLDRYLALLGEAAGQSRPGPKIGASAARG
ncbi:MAG: amino acid adenylation domain-containing protein [Byssovorax sp.]